MIDLPLDTWTIEDKATQEAALGAHALGVGDTEAAREHYSEAGRVLDTQADAAHDARTRALLRFLAASQYFHGGVYQQARKLVRRVEKRFLSDLHRRLLGQFVRDVEARTAADYPKKIRLTIQNLFEQRKFTECLELLKSHPYVLGRPELSAVRASICEEQGRYQAAAIHNARAIKYDPVGLIWLTTATSFVVGLVHAGRRAESLEYLQLLTKEIDHPTISIAATMIYYQLASSSEGDERDAWLEELLKSFQDAWLRFQALPERHQNGRDLRERMNLCLELAAFAHWKLGHKEAALQVRSDGLNFDPNFAGHWFVGGMVQAGTAEGAEDFRKAIELGLSGYIPHYHLAQHYVETGNFEQAMKHIAAVRAEKPDSEILGILYGWEAICLASLNTGATVEDVFKLFEKAIELAPNVPEVQENLAAFREFADKLLWQIAVKKRKWRTPEFRDRSLPDTTPKTPRRPILLSM